MPIASGDILRLVLHSYAVQQQQTQAGLMTLHYRASGVAGVWSLSDVAGVAAATWIQVILPMAMCNHASFYGCECRAETGTDQNMVGWGKPLNPVAGARVGSLMPAQVAAILKKSTERVGRAYRGRSYYPFLSATDLQADGEMSAAVQAILHDTIGPGLFLKLLTKSAGADVVTLQQVIWHRKTKTFDNVVSVSSPGKLGTQRRRGVYGRANVIPPDLMP